MPFLSAQDRNMTNSPTARSAAPVVSVITPTWQREAMLPHAYRSFAHQDLRACEWIVIDDSARPSAFMQGLDDARVLYRHVPQRMSTGAKRNLAVALARAEVIAHFDDDVGLCLHVLHAHSTPASFPQYLLPDALVTRHFPQFAQFVQFAQSVEAVEALRALAPDRPA